MDLGVVADACEKMGVKTTVFVHTLHLLGSISEQITFMPNSIDAAINDGQTLERICLRLDAERILGGSSETLIFHPAGTTQRAGDSVIEIEESLIAGVHDHVGGSRIMAMEY